MKILFFIFLINLNLFADHINWYPDFEDAHTQALKLNKKVMVLLIKKECQECDDALKNAFMNQDYIAKVNEKFVSVIITKGQKNSYPIEMLYTNEYPALFFLDKFELFSCDVLSGRITPKSLKTHLDKCSD